MVRRLSRAIVANDLGEYDKRLDQYDRHSADDWCDICGPCCELQVPWWDEQEALMEAIGGAA